MSNLVQDIGDYFDLLSSVGTLYLYEITNNIPSRSNAHPLTVAFDPPTHKQFVDVTGNSRLIVGQHNACARHSRSLSGQERIESSSSLRRRQLSNLWLQVLPLCCYVLLAARQLSPPSMVSWMVATLLPRSASSSTYSILAAPLGHCCQ